MARSNAVSKVIELIKEPVESLGLSLWDVKFLKEGSSWYLRIFIDKQGGVNIDDCTDVSRLIDPIIDEADPIKQSYYLEVCSPGIERELTEPEHFEQMTGETVCVKLIRPRDGVREFIGKLTGFDGGITVEQADGQISFEKAEIASVRLKDTEE